MYHSLNFIDKRDNTYNTLDSWGLVTDGRPLIAAPGVKTNFVDIPGGDGSLDMSDVPAGRPTYKDRTGSFNLIVLNDGDILNSYEFNNELEWQERYTDLMELLSPSRMKCSLEDDPSYYYEGRFSLKEWKSEQDRSKITIDYTVDPFKYKYQTFDDKWLWDPFDFDNDILFQYYFYGVNPKEKIRERWSWDPFDFDYDTAFDDITPNYKTWTFKIPKRCIGFMNTVPELKWIGSGATKVSFTISGGDIYATLDMVSGKIYNEPSMAFSSVDLANTEYLTCTLKSTDGEQLEGNFYMKFDIGRL